MSAELTRPGRTRLGRAITGRPRRTRTIATVVAAILTIAVYTVADLTERGQAVENGFAAEMKAVAFISYDYPRLPPLRFEVPTIIVGLFAALVIALVRRRWRELLTVLVAGSRLRSAMDLACTCDRPGVYLAGDPGVTARITGGEEKNGGL